MTTNRHEPADTRSMGIVHSALRRDLERTRMVLTDHPYPDPRQRRALASHLSWMMHFLHMHHTGEDVGLWPLIRARNPSAEALLDQMDADHRRIGPAITAVEDAARAYQDDDAARERLLGAVAALADVLLPHLRREELEMMPVVAATLTDEQYRAVEHEHFVAPKGLRELGAEAHWVLDGLPPESREVMLSVVPPVPRFVLLHGFAGSYRRAANRRWGDGAAAKVPSLPLSTVSEEL
jgi:hypothetical protein